MKIANTATGKTYDVVLSRSGENHMVCPECSPSRRHKNAKSMSFNATSGVGVCHHCQARFRVAKPQREERQYKVPEWKNRTKLSDAAVKWFAGRMISQDTLNAMSVSGASEYMPQTERTESVVAFPYYRDGKLINVKYRDGKKNFKMETGAELIFYNIDAVRSVDECVIVEGEIDALSFIEAGVKNVISVPNGAGSTSMEYITACYEYLEHIKRFYLAVDQDTAGFALQQELIRRFGAERCAVVSFGDHKDANEYLVARGGFELAATIAAAVDVPVAGVITQEDIYDSIRNLYVNGLQPGLQLEMPELDKLITWETSRLAVITGIPGHGKSEVVDYIVTRLNVIHGWRAAYYSPENYPLELHHSKIASKITGRSFSSRYIGEDEFERTFDYINDNFYFIFPEEDITVDTILEKAKYTVRKYGVKILVIDPYNKLEHARSAGESETEYVSRFLDRLSMFAKVNKCLVILVAHPTKMQRMKDDRTMYEVPTLYDISGSANFYNKCDYGLVVYRDFKNLIVKIQVAKVKFKHLGSPGESSYTYNSINGRLFTFAEGEDNRTYLGRDWTPVEFTQPPPMSDEEIPF